MVGRHRRTSTRMRATDHPRGFELKYTEKKSRSGSGVVPKREEARSMPAKSAGSEDKRSVLPRGSVLQQNVTKLAATAARSIAVQTEDPACGGLSLWDWLTPTAVTSTATQTTADGRPHQWRLIEGQCWVELQKVQHSIQSTLEQCRDRGRIPRAQSPPAMLQQMKERIHNIAQDMHMPAGRSWCVPP